MTRHEQQVEAVLQVMAEVWDDGGPLGPPRRHVAELAIRRLRSWKRRVKGNPPRTRVRDLSKGLIAKLEAQPDLVGRLIRDYDHLAERIIERLADRGLLDD